MNLLTLPEMLKARGFYLADVGKLFHTLEYAERQFRVFDRLEMHGRPEGWNGPKPILTFPPVPQDARDPAPRDRTSRDFPPWRAPPSDPSGGPGLTRESGGDHRKP